MSLPPSSRAKQFHVRPTPRAIVEGYKALDFNKSDFLPYSVIAAAHFFMGNVAEAREPAEEAVRRAPWSATAVGFLAGLLALTGEEERAEKLIESMHEMIAVA